MAKIRLDVVDDYVSEINGYLTTINGRSQNASADDIAREALAVYRWVTRHTFEGRAVVAVNRDMEPVKQIATAMLPAKPPRI